MERAVRVVIAALFLPLLRPDAVCHQPVVVPLRHWAAGLPHPAFERESAGDGIFLDNSTGKIRRGRERFLELDRDHIDDLRALHDRGGRGLSLRLVLANPLAVDHRDPLSPFRRSV